MKDFQLECIEKNAPLELRELWEPLRTFKDLLHFVSAPRGWSRRGCNQVCGKDGVLRVSFEEFVDENLRLHKKTRKKPATSVIGLGVGHLL